MVDDEESEEFVEFDLGRFFEVAADTADDLGVASPDESKSVNKHPIRIATNPQATTHVRSPPTQGTSRPPTEHGYFVQLYGEFIRRPVSVGDFVSVFSNRKRKYNRCRVVGDCVTDCSSPLFEKYAVSDVKRDKSFFHVRRSLMIPQVRVQKEKPAIAVCRKTSQYRRLAKTQCSAEDDFVVELGSCHAVTTNFILDAGARRVMGLDVDPQPIAYGREKFPQIEFHVCDPFGDLDTFVELTKGCQKMFVDIGGNRALEDVERVLSIVQSTVAPPLIVVKSIELFDKLSTDAALDRREALNSSIIQSMVAVKGIELFDKLSTDTALDRRKEY